jgi:hypothetical protein
MTNRPGSTKQNQKPEDFKEQSTHFWTTGEMRPEDGTFL